MMVFLPSSLVAEVLQGIVQTHQAPIAGPLAPLLGTDPSGVKGSNITVAHLLQRRIQYLVSIIAGVEGHDRKFFELLEEVQQCFGSLTIEQLGLLLPQHLLADSVELQRLLGARMLGSIVVGEGLSFLAILV